MLALAGRPRVFSALLLREESWQRACEHCERQVERREVAFEVFCALGYRGGNPRLWHAEAFPNAEPDNWGAFLAALPGEPRRVV